MDDKKEKESCEKKDSTENGEKGDSSENVKVSETSDAVVNEEKVMADVNTEEKSTEETPMETEPVPTSVAVESEVKVEAEVVKKEEDIKETIEEKKEPQEVIPTHIVRVGWSLMGTSLQLGEEKFSYGYESSGKFVNDTQFVDYGKPFAVGDVISAYLVSLFYTECFLTLRINSRPINLITKYFSFSFLGIFSKYRFFIFIN